MGFSSNQVKALRRDVEKRHLRTRQVESGRILTYIEGWQAIAEANRIFGFDGWDRETLESRCILAKDVRGTYTAIYIARVRITVRAHGEIIIREGHGTGESQGIQPGEVHDKAIKTAETDATKRALATFGKPFGLSLYLSGRSTVRRETAHNASSHATLISPAPALPNSEGSISQSNGGHKGVAPEIGRRRTLQRWAPNGRYFVPPRSQPTSDSFHALLAKEHQADKAIAATSKETSTVTTKTVVNADPKIDVGVRAPLPAESAFLVAHSRRIRDKDHLLFVATQPCLLCGRTPSDAHHLRFAQPSAMSRKVSDEFTVPLCRTHHRQLHQTGDEAAWWVDMRVDPLPIARDLWDQTRGQSANNANEAEHDVNPLS